MMPGGFFTTGEAGKTFGACPRTAKNLLESGELRGFKIPGTREWRVAADDLKAFLIKNGIPLYEFSAAMDAKRHAEIKSIAQAKRRA